MNCCAVVVVVAVTLASLSRVLVVVVDDVVVIRGGRASAIVDGDGCVGESFLRTGRFRCSVALGDCCGDDVGVHPALLGDDDDACLVFLPADDEVGAKYDGTGDKAPLVVVLVVVEDSCCCCVFLALEEAVGCK